MGPQGSEAEVYVQGDSGDGWAVGSGYAIGGGLVLTAGHLIRSDSGNAVNIRLFGESSIADCDVVWSSSRPGADAALLEIRSKRGSDYAPSHNHVQWGRISGTAPIPCQIVGFPHSQRAADGVRDLEQIFGSIMPRANAKSGLVSIALSTSFPKDNQIRSPWAGMSGAPVFSGDHLVGIVVEAPQAFGGSRLLATPIASLASDEEFRSIVEEKTGHPFLVEEIATQSGGPVQDALQQVASANPDDILGVAASQFALSDSYYESVLSQAQRSFLVAIASGIFGLLLFSASILIAALRGEVTAAVLSAIGGSVVEVIAGLNFWIYGRASIQLDAFHVRLDRMQRYLVANSVCTNMADGPRDSARADLVRTIAGSQP